MRHSQPPTYPYVGRVVKYTGKCAENRAELARFRRVVIWTMKFCWRPFTSSKPQILVMGRILFSDNLGNGTD